MSTHSDCRIFVSIACLDDPDVVATVANIYAMAQHPDRVYVGICLQIEPNDPCYQELGDYPNVRTDIIHFEEARGPIYARYRCEQLFDDEDFYLQIDCHSRFFDNWDEVLLDEFEKCQQVSQRAVLSHYPLNINSMNDAEALKTIGHVNRFRQIDAESIKSHGSLIKIPKQPLKSFGISAAMLLMEGKTKAAIPYDPDLHFGLHSAEQVLYAVRLWTHGYDIFTPTRHTLATQYAGARDRIPPDVKKAVRSNRGRWPEKTWSKVKFLLGLDTLEQVDSAYAGFVAASDFKFGMGGERALLDYYRLTEIHETLKKVYPNYRFRSVD